MMMMRYNAMGVWVRQKIGWRDRGPGQPKNQTWNYINKIVRKRSRECFGIGPDAGPSATERDAICGDWWLRAVICVLGLGQSAIRMPQRRSQYFFWVFWKVSIPVININYFSCVNYIGGLGFQIGDYYEQIIKVAILNQLKGSKDDIGNDFLLRVGRLCILLICMQPFRTYPCTLSHHREDRRAARGK